MERDERYFYGRLQPHLLTKKELLEILETRCVDVESSRGITKEMLINIYNRVVLPLPQRTKHRSTEDKNKNMKITTEPPTDEKGCGYSVGFNGTVKSNNDKDTTCEIILDSKSMDRLKPPPKVTNKKKISISNCSSSLDNIVINKRKRNDSRNETTSPTSKLHKSSPTENGEKEVRKVDQSEKKKVEPKRVSLKRNFASKTPTTSKDTEDKHEEEEEEEEVAVVEKQRKKITWP